MMDAAFDGASDGGCQGCVDFWEVCCRDLYGSAGHFVGKGFPGVGLVGGSAVCGLKNEVGRGEVIQGYDAANDGKVVPDLRFQECCYSSGEDDFRAFGWGRLVDFGHVGMDDALVFSCDGFSEGPS